MKTKTIITIALLVFVVASIGYLITKELRALAQSAPDETYSPPVINDKETTSEDANAVKSPVESSQKVVFTIFTERLVVRPAGNLRLFPAKLFSRCSGTNLKMAA